MNKLIFLIAVNYVLSLGAATTTNENEAQETQAKDATVVASAKRTIASAPESAAVATTASGSATVSKWWGDFELRPSWASKGGVWDTENTMELGYKPNPDRLFAYTQYFATALYNPKAAEGSPTLMVQDGFFRYNMANLLMSDDKTLSLSYQPRIYLPTDAGSRAAGLITFTRHYVTVAKKLRENVTLSFVELGILYGYNRAGSSNDGTDVANPIVENREYILLDASLFNGFVDVSMNLLIHHKLTRDYAVTAKNNNRVQHTVWTWPEIDLNIAPHTVVGLSYYSDNFIKDDFSELTLGSGLENGVVQLVFRATL